MTSKSNDTKSTTREGVSWINNPTAMFRSENKKVPINLKGKNREKSKLNENNTQSQPKPGSSKDIAADTKPLKNKKKSGNVVSSSTNRDKQNKDIPNENNTVSQSNNSTDTSNDTGADTGTLKNFKTPSENASSSTNRDVQRNDIANTQSQSKNSTGASKDSAADMATLKNVKTPSGNVSASTNQDVQQKDVANEKKWDGSVKDENPLLNLLDKVINKIKGEDKRFIKLLRLIMDVFNTKNSENRKTKCDILNTLMKNLIHADENELKQLEIDIARAVQYALLTKWFVDDKDFVLEGRIGTGLLKAELKSNNTTRTVAVKASDIIKLQDEAVLLSQMDHPNILKLLAICTTDSLMYIAVEYMDYGSVVNCILRDIIGRADLMKCLVDVASGMEYLHSKNFLHTDLTDEHVFVNRKNEYKIADLSSCVYVGDSKGGYKMHVSRAGMISFTLSPETKKCKIFTFKTDVWSYGVLIWDIYNLLSKNVDPPIANKIFRCPPLCPKMLHNYKNEKLLSVDPSKRPTFADIKNTIQNMKI